MSALLLFAAWALLLVSATFLYRGVRTLGGTPANSWTRGATPEQTGDPALMKRLADAHSNVLESLPIFAVLIFAAALLGKLEAVETAALLIVFARVGQTVTHLVGIAPWLVVIRATFFSAQLALFFWMFLQLLG